jgi:hypothetical protein
LPGVLATRLLPKYIEADEATEEDEFTLTMFTPAADPPEAHLVPEV